MRKYFVSKSEKYSELLFKTNEDEATLFTIEPCIDDESKILSGIIQNKSLNNENSEREGKNLQNEYDTVIDNVQGKLSYLKKIK